MAKVLTASEDRHCGPMVKSRRALKALWSQARGARLVRPVRAIVGRAPASLLSRRDRAHAWPAALPLSHVGGIGQLLTWLVSSRCSDAHANNGIYPNFAGPLLRGGYDRPISPHGDSNDSDTDRLLAGLWTWTGGEELSPGQFMRRGGPQSSTTRACCDVASNQKKCPGSGDGGERAGAGPKGYAMGASGRQCNAAQVKSVPAPAHSRIHRWTPSKAIEHSRTGSRSPSRATSLPPVTGSSLGAAKPAKSND